MGKIHILDENISNKISAGEVVERPASVVKELVENSIDAGSTSITVEIKNGGTSYIRVSDNGIGMDPDDAKNSFIRHATSKINTAQDLTNITTLGFRGEALASIASVSEVEMATKPHESTFGTKIVIEGGKLKFSGDTGCNDGTSIIVKNLFYNTPARLKFLKRESREAAVISDIIYKLAISRPDISFKFINNNKMIFNTQGDGILKNTLLTLYGMDIYKSLIEVSYKGNVLSVSGFIGKPDIARSNRNYQIFFVNKRYIQNRMLSAAVDNAYKTFLMINKFAYCILFISIYPDLVDVNVHPTKAEVRFQDDKEVFSAVFNTVRNGLAGENLIPEVDKDKKIYQGPSAKQQTLSDYTNHMFLRENGFKSQDDKINPIEYDGMKKEYETLSSLQIDDKNILKKSENDFDDENVNHDSDSKALNLLPPLVVIGQCLFTYILAQGPDGLYIIDQHAAHERIMYEKFKSAYERGGVQSQKLLSPLVIDLSPGEICNVKENFEIITKLGFELEFFGNNSVMLRSVPLVFGSPQLKKFFFEIIDSFEDASKGNHSSIDKMIYTMACRSAVKANDRLSIKEMEELIDELRRTYNPYTCPHGRPTIIKLTRNELEKKFKRIQ